MRIYEIRAYGSRADKSKRAISAFPSPFPFSTLRIIADEFTTLSRYLDWRLALAETFARMSPPGNGYR